MYYKNKEIKSDLRIFLAIVATLIIIGLIFIYSASSVYAAEQFGSPHFFIKKQFLGLLLSIICFIIIQCIPFEWVKKLSPLFFIVTVIMTALTTLPSLTRTIHGSSRWLKIFGYAFQPSEFLKIPFILYLSYFLTKKKNAINSLSHTFLPFLIIITIPSLILLKQPDFGTTVTLITTSFFLLFISGMSVTILLSFGAALLPFIFLLIYLKPYRLKRITTFLNPWADPQGAGFQIIQSLIAFGSGHFWGKGISQSQQKFFYLPMQHTDFIVSIIAEETGFIGLFFLILLYILFLYFGLKISSHLTDHFSKLATTGFVLLISLQTAINIAVATGVAPTKGMGLPFISYGNSALLATVIMISLIVKMVRHNFYK